MKYKLYILYFFICSTTWVRAQQDIEQSNTHRQSMEQELLNILTAGKYFEAKDFYSDLRVKGNTLHPAIERYYKYEMANFLNKPDSAAIYLDELLNNYSIFGLSTFDFYYRLWKLYAETLQDYRKALNACNRANYYIEKNPDGADEKTLREWSKFVGDWKNQTRRRAVEPVIKVTRNNSVNTTPVINDSIGLLFFEVGYNSNNRIKTMFDTGVQGYFLMDKSIAEKTGVRKHHIYDNDTVMTFNGVKTSGYTGILDSVQVANVRLYNVPIAVLDMNLLVNVSDSSTIDFAEKEELERFYQSMGVIMGIKAMNLIGKIVLDRENNVLRFPSDKEDTNSRKDANLFVFADRLFTQLKVNNCPLTAFIDTGASKYIDIDSQFYEKNKEAIPVDILTEKEPLSIAMIHGVWQNIPYEIADNPTVMFNDRIVHPGKGDKVYIYSIVGGDAYSNGIDGILAYDFIKNLGKEILFDFRNMRIDILK